MIKLKRIYDTYTHEDGYRVLVDRLWPRGISKKNAHVDLWLKEIAPSDILRKWFAHDSKKWEEFNKRYKNELVQKDEMLTELREEHKRGTITLVYAAKNKAHNNAVVLRDFLEHSR